MKIVWGMWMEGVVLAVMIHVIIIVNIRLMVNAVIKLALIDAVIIIAG